MGRDSVESYFNFMKLFRRNREEWSDVDLAVEAARKWRDMTQSQRKQYSTCVLKKCGVRKISPPRPRCNNWCPFDIVRDTHGKHTELYRIKCRSKKKKYLTKKNNNGPSACGGAKNQPQKCGGDKDDDDDNDEDDGDDSDKDTDVVDDEEEISDDELEGEDYDERANSTNSEVEGGFNGTNGNNGFNGCNGNKPHNIPNYMRSCEQNKAQSRCASPHRCPSPGKSRKAEKARCQTSSNSTIDTECSELPYCSENSPKVKNKRSNSSSICNSLKKNRLTREQRKCLKKAARKSACDDEPSEKTLTKHVPLVTKPETCLKTSNSKKTPVPNNKRNVLWNALCHIM